MREEYVTYKCDICEKVIDEYMESDNKIKTICKAPEYNDKGYRYRQITIDVCKECLDKVAVIEADKTIPRHHEEIKMCMEEMGLPRIYFPEKPPLRFRNASKE